MKTKKQMTEMHLIELMNHKNFMIREWCHCIDLDLLLNDWNKKDKEPYHEEWNWGYLAKKYLEKFFGSKKLCEVHITSPYRIASEYEFASIEDRREFKQFLEKLAKYYE